MSHPDLKNPRGSENSQSYSANVTHFGIPSGFARIFILTGIHLCNAYGECICVRIVYHIFFFNSLSLLTLNDKATYVTYRTAIDITNDTFIFMTYSVFCHIIYDTAIQFYTGL